MTSLMMQSQMLSPRQHWFSPLVTSLKTTLLLVLLPSHRWSKVLKPVKLLLSSVQDLLAMSSRSKVMQLILLITLPSLPAQHRRVAGALRLSQLSQRLLRPLQLLQRLGLRLPRFALPAGPPGWWPLCRRF
ncbi:hypothetical protein PC119_g26840 [Phytophthora cactorum]|nr:hypothetical protein PC111_g23639 [Phytophthora cactorum]KAG2846602.1 hypothetical protein PC113_g17937 [Phytophthora cactorum]KAG2896636.1 hypothetical protein PC115_g17466 [Phytophthora cactorum]KAG2959020.1 hypothetical protein PC119_g26840 [Phytophthora cactorum]KAG3049848.1 hypothetical protein PC121_g18698 [Phytophthora cactorum]